MNLKENIKRLKIDIALFFVLLIYFSYTNMLQMFKPDVGSGLAFTIIVYIAIKVLALNKRFLIAYMVFTALFMFSWILLVSYLQTQGGRMPVEATETVANTNVSEAVQFVFYAVPFYGWIVALSALILIPFFAFKVQPLTLASKKVVTSSVIFLILAIVAIHNNWNVITNVYNIKKITEKFAQFKEEVKIYNTAVEKRRALLKTYNLTSDYNGTVVLIIGESSTSVLMQNYGFFLNDTPFTNNRTDVTMLSDVISSYTGTISSVPDMLTLNDEKKDYTEVDAFDIITVAQDVGFKVYWASNQETIAPTSNGITAIASQANKTAFLNYRVDLSWNNAFGFDEKLLPHFKEFLKDDGKKLIILHLIGSHIQYSKRYPKDFDIFNYDFKDKKFSGNFDDTHDFNDYLNSIYYTDYLLNEIYSLTENSSEPIVTIYNSDHGENPIKRTGHASSSHVYMHEQIPLYVQFNSVAQKQYINLYDNMLKNKNKPYTTFNNPYTVFGLIGLKSSDGLFPSFHRDDLSLFSANYTPEPRKVDNKQTFDVYNSKKNDFYENTHAIMVDIKSKFGDNALDNVYASDIDTIGAVMQAKPLFKGLEAHITIDKNGNAFIGKTGADYKLTLDEYLQSTRGWFKLKFLFVVNKESEHGDNVYKQLEPIFAKYGYDFSSVSFVDSDSDIKQNVQTNTPDFEKLFPLQSRVVVSFPSNFM